MRSSRLLEQSALVAAYKWAGCVFWEVWVRRCEKQLWFLEINSPCLEEWWFLFQDCTRTSFFVTVNRFVALASVHLSGAGVLGKVGIKSGECHSIWKLLVKTGVKLHTAKHPEAPEHVLVGMQTKQKAGILESTTAVDWLLWKYQVFRENLAGKWWGDLCFDVAEGCKTDRTRTWPFWGTPLGLSLSVSAQRDPGDCGYTRGCAGGSVSLLLLFFSALRKQF